MISAASALDFPLMILRFLIHLYGAPRRIVINRGIVLTVKPKRSVIAGCAFADIMMFLVMRIVDAAVTKAAPSAFPAVVADDYQILVCAHEKQAARVAMCAHQAAIAAFGEAMLPVSEKKLVLVYSHDGVAAELCEFCPTLTKSRSCATRNLGIDFTLKGKRRTAVFEARLAKVATKFLKIRMMRRAGVDTPNYVISLINAGQVYGAECIGASPSQVKRRRRHAHRHIVKSSAGRSATLDFSLSRAKVSALDP